MRYIFVIFFLFLSEISFSQEITILQVNAKWNSSNNIDLRSVSGAKISFAYLEDQSENFQKGIKSVPAILIYRDQDLVWKKEAGLTLRLLITREELIDLVKKYKNDKF
jgi:hypothetical protein